MDWEFVGRREELASLVDRIGTGSSVLLTGPLGVGKTRLAEEAQAGLADVHHVERIIGSPSVRHIPFGAVAHLTGEAPMPDPTLLVAFIAGTIRRRAHGLPVAVVVDDIDQVDDGTIALVQHLAANETIPVLATARTERAGDPRVVTLWKDGLVERVDIGPLQRQDADHLTAALLGGPCTVEVANEVWRLAEGQPLMARELVWAALDQSTIVQREGVWTLDGQLQVSQRVTDLVRQRTGDLEPEELDGLRVVALCEPVSLRSARAVASSAVLETLETKNLLRVEAGTEGPVLRSSHPLVAEVTVTQMPVLVRAATTARLAHELLESGAITPTDALRAAVWLLDAGESPPPDVAVDGARAALRNFDPTLAVRLATAALDQADHQEANVLLGRAHAAMGDAPQALEILHRAQDGATHEGELAAAAIALAEVHMFNLGDAGPAVELLESTLEASTEPGPRAEISSHLMLAVGVVGDFDLGLRIGPGVVDQPDLPEPAQLTSLMAFTLTQSMTGKLDAIEARLERAEVLARRYAQLQPFAPDQVGMNKVLALQALGRWIEADHVAGGAVRSGTGLPGPWLYLQAASRLYLGDATGGLRLATEACALLADLDPLGLLPMGQGILGLFQAMHGDIEAAMATIDEVRRDPRGAQARVAVWTDRAEAWATAVGGDTDTAAELARKAGRSAIDATHYVWGAYALHDAVRFDRADLVVEDLATVRAPGRGPMVGLLADHAAVAAAGTADGFDEVRTRFDACGATAMVAECFAQAAHRTDGAARARSTHLALGCGRRCPGLRSPLLADLEPPLSDRQHEVAMLAADDLSSREIGERLHVATRTVDNHLRAAYAVFGIHGRGDLADLFPS